MCVTASSSSLPRAVWWLRDWPLCGRDEQKIGADEDARRVECINKRISWHPAEFNPRKYWQKIGQQFAPFESDLESWKRATSDSIDDSYDGGDGDMVVQFILPHFCRARRFVAPRHPTTRGRHRSRIAMWIFKGEHRAPAVKE